MSDALIHPERAAQPLLPVWVFSIFIHLTTIGLLCFAFQPRPHGAAGAQSNSMGIVLHHANGGGDFNAANQPKIRQALAIDEELEPPVLLTANDTSTAAADNANDESAKSKKQAAGSGAGGAKPATKQTKSGGKSSSRTASSSPRLGSPGSGYAQVSVFGVEGKGSKFIYVFDRSASMEGPPLAAAKNQLLQSLQSLEDVHQFHILFFNTKTQALDISGGGRRIAFASERNKKLAANFVGGITADGGTDRLAALKEAITYSPDVVFFLTDADDVMTPSEMAEIARANRKVQAAICVIEFGKKAAPVPNNFLARLAQESGGQYGYVDTTKLPAGQILLPAKSGSK